MAKKNKYYVVWQGRQTGVFDSWETCKMQIDGFQGAKYKSFEDKDSAQKAFQSDSAQYLQNQSKPISKSKQTKVFMNSKPILTSISVDAACSGNPGVMEYRGVETDTGKEIFYQYYPEGTNNIGEFLAIVHALALFQRNQQALPILYSDSQIAIGWVKKKKCKTNFPPKPQNQRLFEHIARAEQWLEKNVYETKILKWQTEIWGEIPADFGRKK